MTLAGPGLPTVLSTCRRWRYVLGRGSAAGPVATFVGLNPSTADEREDDPTVRKCLGFARRWEVSGVLLVNLYAYRATDPRELRTTPDPVGPDNDRWVQWALERATAHRIAAWGATDRRRHARAETVRGLWEGPWQCLGVTRGGDPRHPLYAPYGAPVHWEPRRCTSR